MAGSMGFHGVPRGSTGHHGRRDLQLGTAPPRRACRGLAAAQRAASAVVGSLGAGGGRGGVEVQVEVKVG